MSPPIEIDRDEARRRALDELATARYQAAPRWWQDIQQWLVERINDLARLVNPPSPTGASGQGGWVFLFAVIVVVLALVVLAWKFGLPRWRRRVADGTVAADPELSPADYRARAERAASDEDWTGAVRERFRAVVRDLEERTVIDPRPARTALEAAGSAARVLPEVETDLHVGALVFNDAMYGSRAADAAAYQRLVAVDSAVGAARMEHLDDEDELDPDRVVPV